MSNNFANAEEKNKGKDGKSTRFKENACEQLPGFTGNLYQSKWLMWYLLKGLSSNYEFELGTEIEDAGKYDDIVFKYKKAINGNVRDHFIIMQSKHKTNIDKKKITYQDVLTDANVDLGMVKYFNSFVKSKNAKLFKGGEIEHAIIYTNARFDMDGIIPEKDQNWKDLKNFRNIIEEMKLKPDDTLSAFKIEGGKFYQFKSDLVFPVLKPMVLDYMYYKIARKLIDCLKNKGKYLSLDDKTLEPYSYFLLTEVIDKKSKKFQNDFLNERYDDVENDTRRKKMRRALDKVLNDELLKIEDITINPFIWRKDFENSGKTIQVCPADIYDADLKEFLKKSVFATKQPNETNLGTIILDELLKQYPIHDKELIHGYLSTEIHNWMKGGNFSENNSKSKFISFKDATNFFTHTLAKFNKILLRGQTLDQDFQIKFLYSEFDSAIKTFLNSGQRILSIISKHVMISSIKLKNNIELEKLIYIKLSSSNKVLLNAAIKTFESEPTNRLLVIEWDYDETKLDDWTDKICDIIDTIRSYHHKKLIIISNRDDILEKYFQNGENPFNDTECVKKRDTVNTLENLEKESQEYFLKVMVKFQGNNAELKDFIDDDDLKNVIDGDILQKILKKEDVDIGKQIEGLKADIQPYYIDRTFTRKVENGKNVYLLIGINELDLYSEYQNFEIIKQYKSPTRNEIDTFKRAVDENKSKNVYLLKKKSNTLILLEKSKFMFEESDFRNAMKCEDNKCEINLLSAVAGTGKSTLFTKLSQKIKDQNPELWIVKIDLNAVSSKLSEIRNSKRDIQFETVIDLLHYGTKHHTELEKKIFEHRLQSKNVELLLDGFDEICPSYKSIVLKMIRILESEATIKTIWVSTRPYDSIMNDMKETFAIFYVKHYNFEPLTEDNQKEYLKIFWRQSIGVDKEFFEPFVYELFKILNNNMKGDFLGVPLHTMLIGIAFEDTFVKFKNSGTREITTEQRRKLSEMVDLSSFYDKFVRFKCQVQSEDKGSLNLDTQAGIDIFNGLYEKCLKKNKILGLDSLLDENELKTLLTETKLKKLKKYKDEIEKKGDPFGLANRIVEEKSQFIHRTFAEYFVAMFFIENFKREEKKSRKYVEYFLENMINDENFVIGDFIDSKLNDESNFIENSNKYGDVVSKIDGGKLYIVLDRRWKNIGEFLIKNGINMNCECDGKSILHPASKLERLKNKKPILSLIFEKMNYEKNKLKSELLKTELHSKDTPLLVAAKNGIFDNVKIMFEKCKTMEILDDVLTNTNKYYGNIIQVTVKCDDIFFFSLLNLLKSEPIKLKDLLTKKNSKDYTPFDSALKYGERNKFKAMWNLCGELDISTDSVIFHETKNDDNIMHITTMVLCNYDCFTYLLNLLSSEPSKLKALLTKKNIEGYTPFDTAVFNGQQNKFEDMWNLCGELEVSTDSVVFDKTKNGENIIHLAANRYCGDDCFNYLLNLLSSEPSKLKALLTKKNIEGYTPFDTAIKYGKRKKFEAMWNLCGELDISTDSVVFDKTKNGENIIHIATMVFCNDDCFTYLLNFLKSEPNKLKNLLEKKNNDSHTPFDTAVENNQRNKFEAMWNMRGELDISTDSVLFKKTSQGTNIIHLATAKLCNYDMFTYLLNILRSEPSKLKDLLIKKSSQGYTPFDSAIKYGEQNKFEAMWNLCGELDISTDSVLLNVTKNGENIIHVASMKFCNYDCFTYILNFLKSEPSKLEALLTKKNNDGYTAFDRVVKYTQRNKFEFMWNLCKEFDISTDSVIFNETKNGENIIHFAAKRFCDDDYFTYLLNLTRSDPNKLKTLLTKKNNKGRTPLNVAEGQEFKFKVLHNTLNELENVSIL